MKQNFKETAAKLSSTFTTSVDPTFIIDVCKYFEINQYLDGLIKVFEIKIINVDVGTGCAFLSEKEDNNKKLFLEIIETALEIFEYCQHSSLDRETTKLAILSVLFYQLDKQIFQNIHSNLEEHKKLKVSTYDLLEKVLASRVKINTKGNNKRLFPLDVTGDAILIRFASLQSEQARQEFITKQWLAYQSPFIERYRQEHFTTRQPEISWIYFNFRNWFTSGDWTTRWSKNKAVALNWPAQAKRSIQIFSRSEEDFSEDSLKQYYSAR